MIPSVKSVNCGVDIRVSATHPMTNRRSSMGLIPPRGKGVVTQESRVVGDVPKS